MSEDHSPATSEVSKRIELKVGDLAPDFTLPSHNEGELNLSWYRGRKHVVLAFYPADFTSTCSTQIPGYEKIIDRFNDANVQLFGISVDSVPSHRAWAESLGGVSFPLLSDFWPHGQVSELYGVLNSDKGSSVRTVFIIDLEGRIRWIERVQSGKLPNNEELFRQIEVLNT